MITASLKNYRIAPRKVRIVADMVRGKKVSEAKNILDNAAKKARHPLSVLIDSAVSNASHNHQITGELYVKEIRVDQGVTMKRSRPMSRGTAFPIKKRNSHVTVTLAPLAQTQGTSKKRSKGTNKKPAVPTRYNL